MHHSLIKKIVLLSLSGFFLAILAVAYHHHNNAFFLASCSICKVKTSIYGTMSKYKIDSASVVTALPPGLAEVFPLFATVVHENTTIFIFSQTADIWPNKAPPVRSSFNNRMDFITIAAGETRFRFCVRRSGIKHRTHIIKCLRLT